MSCVSDYSSRALLVCQTHCPFKEEHLRAHGSEPVITQYVFILLVIVSSGVFTYSKMEEVTVSDEPQSR